jgi:hypothetical protein
VGRFAEDRGGELMLSLKLTLGRNRRSARAQLDRNKFKRNILPTENDPGTGDPPLTTGLALNPIDPAFDGMFAPVTISWIGSLEDSRSMLVKRGDWLSA